MCGYTSPSFKIRRPVYRPSFIFLSFESYWKWIKTNRYHRPKICSLFDYWDCVNHKANVFIAPYPLEDKRHLESALNFFFLNKKKENNKLYNTQSKINKSTWLVFLSGQGDKRSEFIRFHLSNDLPNQIKYT